jgi:hypothetical protein
MRSDVHFAALRAAAKVAFSITLPMTAAVSAGCAANTTGDQTSASNEALTSDKKDCNGGTPKTCQELLDETFPGPDRFGQKLHVEDDDVIACCESVLGIGTSQPSRGAHLWACCSASADGKTELASKAPGFACTPWGPPVPPPMKRGIRATPEVSAWITKAVA